MKDLLEIGFRVAGNWRLSRTGLKLTIDSMANASPALYAFVIRDEVKYVGKTLQPLQRRMYGYLKGSGTQITNIRVRGNILDALEAGEAVHILAFADSRNQRVGKFILNVAAGLEDDIIAQLRPQWNSAQKPIAVHGPQVVSLKKPLLSAPRAVAVRKPLPPARAPRAEPSSADMPYFSVTIGQTYFRSGFFNVPVDFSRYFAKDNEPISIHVSGVDAQITGKISRSANLNNTPRIMGTSALTRWLQSNLEQGDSIKVIVQNPNSIFVSVKK